MEIGLEISASVIKLIVFRIAIITKNIPKNETVRKNNAEGEQTPATNASIPMGTRPQILFSELPTTRMITKKNTV